MVCARQQEDPCWRPTTPHLRSLHFGAAYQGTLEELVHHGDAGQEDAVLLEVHLVVLVAVQVAHQFLELQLHPSFSAGEEATGGNLEAQVGGGKWSRASTGEV